MIRIVRVNKVNNVSKEMSILFVDAFFDYLKSLCSNKEKLSKAFKNIFDSNKFYAVLLDNELIGIGACSDGSSSIKFRKSSLYFNLGFSNGKRMYKYLKTIFEDRDYSFEMDEECGMIEFVAIKEDYRNKKIGYTLVNHMMCDNDYKRYLAKVGDTNGSARKMLDNIEFEVFDEENATGKEREEVGVNKYFYMICENPKFGKK